DRRLSHEHKYPLRSVHPLRLHQRFAARASLRCVFMVARTARPRRTGRSPRLNPKSLTTRSEFMNRLLLTAAMVSVLALSVAAGDFKEMTQTAPPPCPEWYADNEWNVN